MDLRTFKIEGTKPFLTHLALSRFSKDIQKEFSFYSIRIFKKELINGFEMYIEYPQANPFWFTDFTKFVKNVILPQVTTYQKDWLLFLNDLKKQINYEYTQLKDILNTITENEILETMNKYDLRDYQALDLLQLLLKMNFTINKTGLILSEQRTGKTRVAVAASRQILSNKDTCLIICPKSAINGWYEEIKYISKYLNDENISVSECLTTKLLAGNNYDPNKLNYKIITYDLFKRLTKTQIFKQLLNDSKNSKLLIICDEIHRLRNFNSQQSEAIFNFKKELIKNNNTFYEIGITGTPAVMNSTDVFGIMSFINFSKINFKNNYISFNLFKEYFYNCEDTSFGKICKSIKRKDELNFLLQFQSVQTKQKNLNLFKNYSKKYIKIDLEMQPEQINYYENIDTYMEYEDVDCKNNLVKYTRLQQICLSPKLLFASSSLEAPKIKYIEKFVQVNREKTIIISKSVKMLNLISDKLNEINIEHSYINGSLSATKRLCEVKLFKENQNVQIMLLQLDAGKESLTLPEAKYTIFTDRSFTQGYNEQAEARMTPVNGEACVKYVIDLVMKNTIEETIYEILVQRKESINDVNVLFKS